MTNLIASAIVALSTPTDTTIADSSWVTIFSEWEYEISCEQDSIADHFIDNSIVETWETEDNFWKTTNATNEDFDTTYSESLDTSGYILYMMMYWTATPKDTTSK